eukprot:scaffold3158_cov389-Prasinococcus_capsulatus_cf.AAC.14
MATEVRMIRENLNQHMALIEKLTILNEELMDSFNTLQQVRQRELEELTKAQLSAPDAPGASFISPTAEDSPLPASSIEHGAPLNHSTSTRENELPSNEAVAVTITPNIQSTGDNNNLEQSNGGEAAGLVKGSVKVAQATGKAAQVHLLSAKPGANSRTIHPKLSLTSASGSVGPLELHVWLSCAASTAKLRAP